MPASAFVAPGRHPIVNPIVPQGPWDMLAGGHRLKGVNINARQIFAGHENFAALLWDTWDWTGLIKPQIDQAKTLGANVIRFCGTQGGRPPSQALAGGSLPSLAGGFPQTTDANYLARWKQALDYCRSISMYVYPCALGGDSDVTDFSTYGYVPTTASLITELQILLPYLTQWADIIIGIDLDNEVRDSQSTALGYYPAGTSWLVTSDNGGQVYRAAKAAAPGFKYTWSNGRTANSAAPSPTNGSVTDRLNVQDYHDLHVYYDAAATDMDSMLSTYRGPLVIGEFGANQGQSTGARQSRYSALSAVSGNITSGRKVAGVINWSMIPQSTTAAVDYGLCDATITPRSDVSTIFSAMPA